MSNVTIILVCSRCDTSGSAAFTPRMELRAVHQRDLDVQSLCMTGIGSYCMQKWDASGQGTRLSFSQLCRASLPLVLPAGMHGQDVNAWVPWKDW